MARTRVDLAEAVLSYLFVTEGSETPSAEDQQTVLSKIDDVFEELAEQSLNYWPDDQIPLTVFDALEKLVGARICRRFVSEQEFASYEVREIMAMRKLGAVTSKPYAERTVRASYI